jgi:hypothetical protein
VLGGRKRWVVRESSGRLCSGIAFSEGLSTQSSTLGCLVGVGESFLDESETGKVLGQLEQLGRREHDASALVIEAAPLTSGRGLDEEGGVWLHRSSPCVSNCC